jgi:hypothetical protein
MAAIDSRLLPLIETLIAADADWLALEILDGLRLGRVREETREDLKSTQLAVRAAKHQERRSEERAVPPPVGTSIVGDQQIDWAVEYVVDRLFSAVSMLRASFTQLNEIVSRNPEFHAPAYDGAIEKQLDVAVQVEAEGPSLSSSDVDRAIATIPKLREALTTWADGIRNGGHRA